MYPYHLYDGVPGLDVHKIVCEIDTSALESNYKLLSAQNRGSRSICVVKADAYGHTASICVPLLLSLGCDFFAVSCIEEAIAVRNICRGEARHADILILGYTDSSQVKMLADNDIIQTALSGSHARELSRAALLSGCSLRIHIAIDTGMNRIGLCSYSNELCEHAANEADKICKLPALRVEGIFTHFARSDEESPTAPDSRTRLQAERFLKVKALLASRGISLFSHACNSAAAIHFPEYAFDAVRLGITLYGIYPSEHFEDIGLRPVMSLSTVISHIHTVPAGESVSYGGMYKAEKETKVATLPIGYADGFLRKYSGAYVTVINRNGEFKAPIIGRICMDQCMIDVTDLEVSVGDKVTLFGKEACELRALAALADTIEYECLCLISARVPRIKK